MAEQELNLFQFAAAGVAQLGARPAQVMRGDVFQPYAEAVAPHHVPDNVLTDPVVPNCSILADGAEHSPGADLGRRGPAVQLLFGPVRNGYGPNMASLSNQVYDDPMSLTNLYLLDRQVRQLTATKAAPHQDCQHRTVPSLLQTVAGCAVHQTRALLQAYPAARAMPELLGTLHALNPGSQVSTQQSAVRGFVGQPADGS